MAVHGRSFGYAARFGLLDTALISVPVFLTLLGLIRGAPVELASCCGCVAGIAVAWFVSCLPPLQALGQPVAPLLALLSGVVAWQIMRGLSKRFGFDTRWVDLGRLFDAFVGGAMGGSVASPSSQQAVCPTR